MVPQVLASDVPFVAMMPFIMTIVIVALVITFGIFKKHYEHKQIMAAIEKGTTLSELKPIVHSRRSANWIRSLTGGLAWLLMGSGWLVLRYIGCGPHFSDPDANSGISIAAIVIISFGIAGIVRGILQRKVDKEQSALDANKGQ